MPRKIRELIRDLQQAGFTQIKRGGKGSHRKFAHPNYSRIVTVSGGESDDAKPYQEKQVAKALEAVNDSE